MYDFQKQLRRIARVALQQRGYAVDIVPGTGGHRVKITKDGQPELALVRTSRDRWVGWMRDGAQWRGFNEANIVVVASTNHRDVPTTAEVFAFDPRDVHRRLAEHLAAREAVGPVPATAPNFICLDKLERNLTADVGSGFKEMALWRLELPFNISPALKSSEAPQERDAKAGGESSPSNPEQATETQESFARRVIEEFAQLV